MGGRVFTDRTSFAADVAVELGGEFIDTSHKNMWQLIGELNLETIDTWNSISADMSSYDYFINRKRSTDEYNKEWRSCYKKIINTSFDDKRSLKEYCDSIKINGWFREYLRWVFTAEFGLDYSELSSRSLFEMIGSHLEAGELKHTLFEDVTDQRYKIKGGNDRLISAMERVIESSIFFQHRLGGISRHEDHYQLHFDNDRVYSADYIILALPLTTLKFIRFDGVILSEHKRRMIENSRYGTNSKVILGFQSRTWRTNKSAGFAITNNLQSGWDSSLQQNNEEGYGAYTFFMGGEEGRSVASTSGHVERCVQMVEDLYPGTKSSYSGTSRIYNWSQDPFAKGSYLCLGKGERSTYSFEEWQKPDDRIFFVGEHCSEKYQGFMNGAAESARQTVARLIKEVAAR